MSFGPLYPKKQFPIVSISSTSDLSNQTGEILNNQTKYLSQVPDFPFRHFLKSTEPIFASFLQFYSLSLTFSLKKPARKLFLTKISFKKTLIFVKNSISGMFFSLKLRLRQQNCKKRCKNRLCAFQKNAKKR